MLVHWRCYTAGMAPKWVQVGKVEVGAAKRRGASGQGREAQLLVKRCFTSQLPPLNAAGWHSRRLVNQNRFHRGA